MDAPPTTLQPRKLRDSEQRYRALVEASGALVVDADAQLNFRARNREWQAYTGQAFADYAGLGWLEAIHPEDRPTIRTLVADAVAGGGTFHAEARLRHGPTGTWRHQELRVVPIRLGHARVHAWVGVWLDVDARRAAEDALRASDRRKDEFLAIMAHELRNPLAPLVNSLELLQRRGIDDPLVRELVDTASRQSALLVRLVDDLMEASRIGRGLIELRREPVLLAEVIGAAIEIGRPLIEERQQRLSVYQSSPHLQVYGDRARLTQVIANLLNNAAKYTKRQGAIDIHALREGDHAILSVTDDGRGIPRSMLSRIFDLFTQVEASAERRHGGLGIGLSLVERLVQLHDGTVVAHSEGPGRGSRFVVRLPLLAAQRAGPEAAPAPRVDVAPFPPLDPRPGADAAQS